MNPSPIPFFDYRSVGSGDEELLACMAGVVDRGKFILQEELEAFEKELAAFIGAPHVIGVGNGTDALILALRALGVGPGSEVILPSHTYVATAAAVHFVGATPVLVDCGADHLIEPACVKEAITPRTRALMPVQLNGRTADMDALQDIADAHDLLIIEDAAQAIGSRWRERHAGTFGAAGTFSFYPAKVLGCFGDGGALATRDDEVARRVRLLRDHGRDETGEFVAWGLNSRLDNLQAAVLRIKLRRLPGMIERRREIARRYHQALDGLPGVRVPPGPDDDPRHFDVFQNYEIECEERDSLRHHLERAGIGSTIQWGGKAIHQIKELGFDTTLPRTDALFSRCLLLPMHPGLNDHEVDRICTAVRDFFARRSQD